MKVIRSSVTCGVIALPLKEISSLDLWKESLKRMEE
jgi:hypothetical protein